MDYSSPPNPGCPLAWTDKDSSREKEHDVPAVVGSPPPTSGRKDVQTINPPPCIKAVTPQSLIVPEVNERAGENMFFSRNSSRVSDCHKSKAKIFEKINLNRPPVSPP